MIVPYGAGVGSAIGLLEAEPRIDVTVTRIMHLDAERSRAREIAALYRELEAQAMQDVKRVAASGKPAMVALRADALRRAGVRDPRGSAGGPDRRRAMAGRAIDAFKRAYLRKHKFLDPEGSVEAVDWTLVATMPSRGGSASSVGPTAAGGARAQGVQAAHGSRRAGGYTDTQIVDRTRSGLAPPSRVQRSSRTRTARRSILPGDMARMSDKGHIIIEIAERGFAMKDSRLGRSHHAHRDLELADLDRRRARRHLAAHGLLGGRARGRRLLHGPLRPQRRHDRAGQFQPGASGLHAGDGQDTCCDTSRSRR